MAARTVMQHKWWKTSNEVWTLLSHCWTQMMLQKSLVVLRIDSATSWDHMVEDDTIDIISHNEHQFDPTGFLANFL
jgi:hypothetical protein